MKNFTRLIAIIMAVLLVITMSGCTKVKNTKAARGNVTGKVFDSNGKVLRDAKVEIYGTTLSTTTDVMGQYVLSNIDPGQIKLIATHEGKSVVLVVEIIQGQTTENCDLTFKVVDNLPPLITNVSVAELQDNVATITWITNEPADSIIDYATGSIGLQYTMTASDYGMVTEHKLGLLGLIPGQTYHFRVKSHDFNQNEGVSSDYQFTTPRGDAPAMPQGFYLGIATEAEKLDLMWLSNSESDLAGYNLYRSESPKGTFVKINASPIKNEPAAVTFKDEGLKIATKYYYYLKAVDLAGNESPATEIHSAVTPGILDENRTWTLENSPYIIGGDIRVKGGAILTIEPGVEVKFTTKDLIPDGLGASTMSELIIQGALMAQGTENKHIIFTSAESFPRKNVWGGILFFGTLQAQNIMRHCTVLFADKGVKSDAASPSIENCEFGYCGVGLDLGLSISLNIKGNIIRDCELGLVSSNSNIRNNIFVSNGLAATLMGNDFFENNTIDSIIGVEVAAGNPTIKNNIITYTPAKGIYGINQTNASATPVISYNDIYNISLAFNGTTGTGTANIEVDPLFVGGMPYDYHLQTIATGYASDSVCLTAGDANTQQGAYGP